MAGLGERLCGPNMVGINEMRTQFWRLCPGLRALGLPFKAEGFPTDTGAVSHWNGLSLLLRVDEARVEVCES